MNLLNEKLAIVRRQKTVINSMLKNETDEDKIKIFNKMINDLSAEEEEILKVLKVELWLIVLLIQGKLKD